MKLVILWNKQTDYAREVREWLRDFSHEVPAAVKSMQEIDPETVAGVNFSGAYDILQFPAVVVTDDDGKLTKMWKGTPMPQIEEVSYWVNR